MGDVMMHMMVEKVYKDETSGYFNVKAKRSLRACLSDMVVNGVNTFSYLHHAIKNFQSNIEGAKPAKIK
jgi:hypothetical protein